MKKLHRYGDFSGTAAKQRELPSEQGWRGLLQVRRVDIKRMLRSFAIVLPLLAGVMVLVLSMVNMRLYHLQALAAMELQVERYALGMDRLFDQLINDAIAASSAITAAVNGQAVAIPGAESAKLIRLGPLGIADKDNAELDGLRHIERDMLRRSLDKQAPVVDVYRDGAVWILGVAQPIAGVGVLLASYPEQLLTGELRRFVSSDQISLALRFKVQGNWRNVAQLGEFNSTRASAQASLEDPMWAVHLGMDEWGYERWVYRNLWLYVVLVIALAASFLQVVLALHRIRLRRQALLGSATETATDAEEREQCLIASAFLPAAESGSASLNSSVKNAQGDAGSSQSGDLGDNGFLDVLAMPAAADAATASDSPVSPVVDFESSVFRAYDIRGIADSQLTPELCRHIGLAIGAELKQRAQSRVLVARDGRNSSPRIRDALVEGLLNSGIDVTDLGAVPTPLMHFATHELAVANGLMITGSHNGREYNGIKIVMQGKSLTEDGIHSLRNRIVEQGFAITEGQRGRYGNKSVADRYVERVCEDVVVARRLKVVVDAANGIAGPIAPRVFQALGCSVEPLYCELDGDFPNHDPDPTRPGNLHALQAAVRAKRADLGIAFDGDGDRVVFVTSTGEVVYPDQVLMVLAQDVVARHPGATVVYDVKCSSHVAQVVSEAGGIPLMCRSGHSYVKHQLETSKAQLGGEFTGHIFLSERWYGFDDGIYVAARMLELLSLSPKKLHQILDTLPASVSTPELLVETDDSHKFVIIGQLKAGDYFADAELNLLDGIRAEFPFGWGLVRASNTCPALSLRFEADTADNLAKIQAEFRQALNTVDPTLALGF
ncbi:MAG: phosphomannomutase/phosphoglucomutase [Bacteroidia bacterium]|jgi:phosphomannomutase/phosphoglucomutase